MAGWSFLAVVAVVAGVGKAALGAEAPQPRRVLGDLAGILVAQLAAGHAQRIGARRLIYLGLSVAALSLLALAYVDDFVWVTAARSAAGLGQGALFIGVQCFILAKAPPEKKTLKLGQTLTKTNPRQRFIFAFLFKKYIFKIKKREMKGC